MLSTKNQNLLNLSQNRVFSEVEGASKITGFLGVVYKSGLNYGRTFSQLISSKYTMESCSRLNNNNEFSLK